MSDRDTVMTINNPSTASFDTASFDTASFDTASLDTASLDTASLDTASFHYEVPVDPMDDLQCESCQ